ncbi:MAG: RecX family transcriptional regulator, partial [Chloroflexi bacterium]|nr:RecX family transcriptional regulator [Chloroflexota bacterium]
LDGQFAFGLPALEAARLRVGQRLTDDDIERLQATDQRQRAYDRAVHYLSFRPRSTAEVRRHLAGEALDAAMVEGVIERLTQQGYLNDAEFARFWVDNRQRFRPRGPRALRQELREHGLEGAVIDAALEDLDAAESAFTLAQHRASRMADLAASDPVAFRRKLGDFLARRGYDYEIVRNVVARVAAELGSPDATDET